MFFRIRRATACLGVVALATGASLALGVAPGGASVAKASGVKPAATVPDTVGINGLCGGASVAAIPDNIRQGEAESNKLHVFRERLNHPLDNAVEVDVTAVGLYDQPADLPSTKPVIASGTVVNSYLLHSDPPGPGTTVQHRAATVGFTSDVLGVQFIKATLTNTPSVDTVRSPTTAYPLTTSGLELVASGNGDNVRVINRRTVSISFNTSVATDEIRVITKGTTSTATSLKGYRMLAADGGVFDFGGQQFYGSTGGQVLNQPIVAGVNTCSNAGYWFVARDGGVFSYGDAAFYGSDGGHALPAPVVAMVATPTGAGYYLALANGQIDAFGDAKRFFNNPAPGVTRHEDASYLQLAKPIVAMAVTPSGKGYWLVAGDGGIFSFGDAPFFGSTGGIHLNSPVIGMFSAVDGQGYYLYAGDGGMFTFQSSHVHEPFFGSAGGVAHTNPVVGARLASDGQGYYFTDSAGILFNFGPSAPRATPRADMAGVSLFRPMIGMM